MYPFRLPWTRLNLNLLSYYIRKMTSCMYINTPTLHTLHAGTGAVEKTGEGSGAENWGGSPLCPDLEPPLCIMLHCCCVGLHCTCTYILTFSKDPGIAMFMSCKTCSSVNFSIQSSSAAVLCCRHRLLQKTVSANKRGNVIIITIWLISQYHVVFK